MKKAAVRLKYVEAKVKLKKQMEIERANKEIETTNWGRRDRKGRNGKLFLLLLMNRSRSS